MKSKFISTTRFSVNTLFYTLLLAAFGYTLLYLSKFFEGGVQDMVMTTVSSRNMTLMSWFILIGSGCMLLLSCMNFIFSKTYSIQTVESPFSKWIQRLFGYAIIMLIISLVLSLAHYHISSVSMQELTQGNFLEAKKIGAPLKTLQIISTGTSYTICILIPAIILSGFHLVKSYKNKS